MASPFTSLSAPITRWPARTPRREVLLVSDGVDFFEDAFGNMSVEQRSALQQPPMVQLLSVNGLARIYGAVFFGKSINTMSEFSRSRSNTMRFPSGVMSKVMITAGLSS
jgi:hypothetical protein